MGEATQEQLNNPLHGVKLQAILEYLEAKIGCMPSVAPAYCD